MLRFIAAVLLLFSASTAEAVTRGDVRSASDYSAVHLGMSVLKYNPRLNETWIYSTTCSGSVVGLKPFTVLTAAHCLHNVVMNIKTGLPEVELRNVKSKGQALVLKHAIYPSASITHRDYGSDIAFLIFDGEPDGNWRALPLGLSEAKTQVTICGFGASSVEADIADPRCAEKNIVREVLDIRSYLPAWYETSTHDAFLETNGAFLSKRNLGKIADILGVHRLNEVGDYDLSLPIPKDGDSGSAWLTRDISGHLEIIGVTSFVDKFRGRSEVWPVLKDPSLDRDDHPIAAFAVKVDSPSAKKIIRAALEAGADIQIKQSTALR